MRRSVRNRPRGRGPRLEGGGRGGEEGGSTGPAEEGEGGEDETEDGFAKAGHGCSPRQR
jgi:hypothetical protein